MTVEGLSYAGEQLPELGAGGQVEGDEASGLKPIGLRACSAGETSSVR